MTRFITNTGVAIISNRTVRPIIQGVAVAFLAISSVAMVGCSKTIKPDEHKPTKLVQLEQQVNLLEPVFAVTTSAKGNAKDPLSLQVGLNGNQVIVASRDGNVSAYDAQGKNLWQVNVGSEITGGVAVDASHDIAIVSTRDAKIIALDGKTGQVRWQRPTTGTILSPALIHNNRVIVSGNDGLLQGLSLQSGNPVWQFATQVPSISVRGSASPVLLDDSTVLIATADGRLHALNIETGQPLWSRRVGVPSGASEVQRMTDIDGNPVVDNGQLFAISYSGQLVGVDLRSERILFVQDASSLKSLATTNDSVIATTLSGDVKAFNRVTGEPMWENSELRYRQLTNPVLIGNYIAVGDLEGVVHLLSPQTGKIVSRTSTKGALSTLQVQADNLMTQSQSGQVNIWRLSH
ncbi:outer membrane protein assembly factor BamB [Psychrobacter sp. I-STPA6b]|uniref:outer membrane protein assembly factor BamB n=1 Tax=Psychrobacter sp. I-STPA6b TaxID=2585718 RepID=UPI001D0BF9A3|nr:outer membrane protein assembly factor BamB [Psychrobacter sp. I-STPA6b]